MTGKKGKQGCYDTGYIKLLVQKRDCLQPVFMSVMFQVVKLTLLEKVVNSVGK